MKPFSRHMPRLTVEPLALRARILYGVIAGILLALLIRWILVAVVARYIVGGFALVYAVAVAWEGHRRRRMHKERTGENICGFVRAFEKGKVDPWVLRAVYEEVSAWTEIDGRRCAVRPDDRLKDLGLVDEDLCMLLYDVCERSRRSTEGWEQNPYASDITTVRQLVQAVNFQAERTGTEQKPPSEPAK